MEFIITRTSDFWMEKPPCSKAKEKVDDGLKFYAIEINSLEELLKLIDEEGMLVLNGHEGSYSVEIYDDYRE